uniref:Gluconokinase n=1 Tax=Romanomermis culicivorax TaxID=13658 RepID=A0A915IPH2_ROMCU
MGVSCCGKTTIGKELARRLAKLDYRFFDGDDFHSSENIAKMSNGLPLNDEDRKPWLECLSNLIEENVLQSRNVILACSSLKRSYRSILNRHCSCCFVHLKIDVEEAKRRILARKSHFFVVKLIEDQFQNFEDIDQSEKINFLVIDGSQSADLICSEILNELKLSDK